MIANESHSAALAVQKDLIELHHEILLDGGLTLNYKKFCFNIYSTFLVLCFKTLQLECWERKDG